MRILVIFIDMIRANRLSLFNKDILAKTYLDKELEKIGGTVYTNFFSECPDTPRAMASFISGKLPHQNNCNLRTKWPRYFLESKTNIFDSLMEKDYSLNFFSNPNERKTGMFSDNISNLNIHNKDFNLNKYLNQIELKKNHFVFISLPDFHWAIDDFGANTYGEKKGYKIISDNLNIIFKNFNKDSFDHIFIFSDHGFKLQHESKKEPLFQILNSDRTNSILIHRNKNENEIKYSKKLCGISQFYSTINDLIQNTKTENSFIDGPPKSHVIIEDFLDFKQSINSYPNIWSCVTSENIYIRTLENGYLISRKNDIIKKGIEKAKDNLIAQNSSFLKIINEKKKIDDYKNFILKQTQYMNGKQRKKLPFILKNFFSLKDYLNNV